MNENMRRGFFAGYVITFFLTLTLAISGILHHPDRWFKTLLILAEMQAFNFAIIDCLVNDDFLYTRKAIAYLLSHGLYWVGDFISKGLYFNRLAWLYPVYNRVMIWSNELQSWAGNKTPWSVPEPEVTSANAGEATSESSSSS